VVVFALVFGRRFVQAMRASSLWTRLVGTIFLAVIALLLVLVLAGEVTLVKDRWLLPYFFILPLYFSLKLDALNQTIGNAPKRFGLIAVMIMMAVPIALVARVVAPQWTGQYGKLNVPYLSAVEAMLSDGATRPALVLAEDLQLAGNIRLAAPDIPVVVPGYEHFEKGVEFDETHPLLVIWRARDLSGNSVPQPMAQLLAKAFAISGAMPEPRDIALPYIYGRAGDSYRFRYVRVPMQPPEPAP
jgi:hypothetical protein